MKLFKEQFNIIIWMSSLRLGFHMEILQPFAFWCSPKKWRCRCYVKPA